jgi:4-hydroxy-2-oxoglutarate aldolase
MAAFERNLDGYARHALAGYLVLGSNGEANVLELPEKLELIAAARRRAGNRVLIAGTGLESTRATIELTRKAADLGADAALVLTPHYFKARMTDEALRRHFVAVADAAPIPVLVYSVPVVTGLLASVGLVTQLAGHPNIAGIKESSGDVALLGRIVSGAPEAFAALCGSGPVAYPALCVGASGGVLAFACCAPGVACALYEAFQRGDHARARRIQAEAVPLAQAVTSGNGVAGLKAAMDLAGFSGGSVREPLLPASPTTRDELGPLLARAERALA